MLTVPSSWYYWNTVERDIKPHISSIHLFNTEKISLHIFTWLFLSVLEFPMTLSPTSNNGYPSRGDSLPTRCSSSFSLLFRGWKINMVKIKLWTHKKTAVNVLKLNSKAFNWAASSEFGTYRLCEQRRFRRACASAQSRQNLRCSPIQAVSQEESSDRKPDPWPLWMAVHA